MECVRKEKAAMTEENYDGGASIFDTIDTFVSAVPWTQNRMVLVFLREHGGRMFVRLRTFNRHRTKGCWYPSRRYFVIPQECANDLAVAIQAAADGLLVEPPPDWYHDFQKQYAQLRASSR